MTGINGLNPAENHGDLLRMLLAVERAKDTIQQFEAGEINIHEAIRQLTMTDYG
jgi:hypothetical protein